MFRFSVTASALTALLSVGTADGSQRQFVASTGNDADPCTLAQPCRSFGVAVAAVDPRGEVIVLDSAGYGPVTITKAVSIVAPAGVHAGITVPPGQDGVTIDAPGPAVTVNLEGLTIDGRAFGGIGGNYGIRVINATDLIVSNCSIRGMLHDGINVGGGATLRARVYKSTSSDNVGNGFFINYGTASIDSSHFDHNLNSGIVAMDSTTIVVKNSTATANGSYGVRLMASASTETIGVVDSSALMANGSGGAQAVSSGSFSAAHLDVIRSTASRSDNLGISALVTGTGSAFVRATGNIVSDNASHAISADGAGAQVIATGNSVSQNFGAGLAGLNGGQISSGGDNTVYGNSPDTLGAVSTLTKL